MGLSTAEWGTLSGFADSQRSIRYGTVLWEASPDPEVNGMRENLRRRRGPGDSDDAMNHRSTDLPNAEHSHSFIASLNEAVLRFTLATIAVVLLLPAKLLAQPPWERAARNLEQVFTGPLARSLALVAIVIGGLMFMFGEAGAKRQISGIVFGGGLALFAAQFLTWLF
jgi:type IV secretory pathway VirB2 component (pilin)